MMELIILIVLVVIVAIGARKDAKREAKDIDDFWITEARLSGKSHWSDD